MDNKTTVRHILSEIEKDYLWLTSNAKLMQMEDREVDGAMYEIRISKTEVLELFTEDFRVTKHKIIQK